MHFTKALSHGAVLTVKCSLYIFSLSLSLSLSLSVCVCVFIYLSIFLLDITVVFCPVTTLCTVLIYLHPYQQLQ